MDDSLGESAVFPVDVNFIAATSYESFYRAIFPNFGQGWQQIDKTIVALHQHLGDTCRTAEVTVNLEGGMRIEHIRIGAAALFDSTENEKSVSSQCQLVFDELVGVFTI